MAAIRAQIAPVELHLRPVRIREEGDPSWVVAQLELVNANAVLMSQVLTLTRDDIRDFGTRIAEVGSGRSSTCWLSNMDENFVLAAREMQGTGVAWLGFWSGEPHELMKGYGFLVTGAALVQFAQSLLSEEAALTP